MKRGSEVVGGVWSELLNLLVLLVKLFKAQFHSSPFVSLAYYLNPAIE